MDYNPAAHVIVGYTAVVVLGFLWATVHYENRKI